MYAISLKLVDIYFAGSESTTEEVVLWKPLLQVTTQN